MIEARSLSKTYGDKTAVDDVSFTVRPGIVTTLFLTIPAVLIAFLVGQAILSSQHIQALAAAYAARFRHEPSR